MQHWVKQQQNEIPSSYLSSIDLWAKRFLWDVSKSKTMLCFAGRLVSNRNENEDLDCSSLSSSLVSMVLTLLCYLVFVSLPTLCLDLFVCVGLISCVWLPGLPVVRLSPWYAQKPHRFTIYECRDANLIVANLTVIWSQSKTVYIQGFGIWYFTFSPIAVFKLWPHRLIIVPRFDAEL